MSPADVCRAVYDAGLTVRAHGDSLVLKPAERLTPALRELLVTHKPELMQFLRDAERTAAELMAAAMRACDYHHDGECARAEMRNDVVAIPPHLRADLLDHFRRNHRARP